ncbi:hypothetical protein TL18_05065 [Methanobrevibacter sp. YE315]|uniref:hypothetical protein n=1 Tax=Methanobrevibacter sp. YE315 TaxID=1609968 RepID=UPI000764DA0F|nr:hypothetical protein [Methanobrevibacter sp. YE315]AMD17444.1 hypothetical protein TL18_05065 [Methanobrevibacter sp. YE315]
MANQKMEIELTPEQAEKVEILQSNGISVGEAIDMLFTIKDDINSQDLESHFDDIDNELEVFLKLNDDSIAYENKRKILESEYGPAAETYEMRAQKAKRSISWAKDFFNF